jgi:cysteine-rich repeat protein
MRFDRSCSLFASLLLIGPLGGCSEEDPAPRGRDASIVETDDAGAIAMNDGGVDGADAGAELDAGPVPDAAPPPVCETDADCDDLEPCNGVERCAPSGDRCVRADPVADGIACTNPEIEAGVCRAAHCIAPTCGDGFIDDGEECDDGNDVRADGCTPECRFTCLVDDDCVDASVCNGTETCNRETHRCVRGERIVCNDRNACTTDACDDVSGCVFEIIDGDGDGHAASELGRCGSDCNDRDPDVYEGAPEICDGVDNNCADGTDDEAPQTWYRDCDGDGYAPTTAITRVSCEAPTGPECATATTRWTLIDPDRDADCADLDASRRPRAIETVADGIDQDCDGGDTCYLDTDDDGFRPTLPVPRDSTDLDCSDAFEARATDPTGDCCDIDADAFPGQPGYFSSVHACGSFDYDCSGANNKRFPATAATLSCEGESGCGSGSSTVGDWIGAPSPACGASGTYHSGCDSICRPQMSTRTQTCR